MDFVRLEIGSFMGESIPARDDIHQVLRRARGEKVDIRRGRFRLESNLCSGVERLLEELPFEGLRPAPAVHHVVRRAADHAHGPAGSSDDPIGNCERTDLHTKARKILEAIASKVVSNSFRVGPRAGADTRFHFEDLDRFAGPRESNRGGESGDPRTGDVDLLHHDRRIVPRQNKLPLPDVTISPRKAGCARTEEPRFIYGLPHIEIAPQRPFDPVVAYVNRWTSTICCASSP